MSNSKLVLKLNAEETEHLREFCHAVGKPWEAVAKYMIFSAIDKYVQLALERQQKEESSEPTEHNTETGVPAGNNSEGVSILSNNSDSLPDKEETGTDAG